MICSTPCTSFALNSPELCKHVYRFLRNTICNNPECVREKHIPMLLRRDPYWESSPSGQMGRFFRFDCRFRVNSFKMSIVPEKISHFSGTMCV